MRPATKVLAPLALGLAALVVAAGCGSSSSTTNTASSGSPDTSKVYKIGVTQIVTHPALDAAVEGFKQALADKGVQATYDMQNAEGNMATAAQIAQKFAGEQLDLILGVATPRTRSRFSPANFWAIWAVVAMSPSAFCMS